jgi:predicted Zn-dependent protease
MTKKCLTLLLLISICNACATPRASELGPVASTPPNSTTPTTSVVASADGSAMAIFAQARLRAGEGDLDGALLLLNKAMELDPASPFLHTAAAQINLQQNHPEEALAHCEVAIRIDPSFVPAQLMAGNILASMQREKDAIPYFKKVMELDPTKEEVYLHVAIFYLKSFEYEQAVNTLKAMVKAAPESPLGYYYLAKTYDQMRLPREALSY